MNAYTHQNHQPTSGMCSMHVCIYTKKILIKIDQTPPNNKVTVDITKYNQREKHTHTGEETGYV